MKLERPDIPPVMNLHSVTAENIQLTDYVGKKVLLSFFRDTLCPFTNIWLNGLVQNESFYKEHNLFIIGVFNDIPMKVVKAVNDMKINFPIIADEGLFLCSKFGIQSSSLGRVKTILKLRNLKKLINYKGAKGRSTTNILPAEFLIDERGLTYNAHYGKDNGDHIRASDIIKWIKN